MYGENSSMTRRDEMFSSSTEAFSLSTIESKKKKVEGKENSPASS
jgi:hypothetical protein